MFDDVHWKDKKELESVRNDKPASVTASLLVSLYSKGQLRFGRYYGLVPKRLMGMPRTISIEGGRRYAK